MTATPKMPPGLVSVPAEPSCRICSGERSDILYRQESFEVRRCRACRTVFVQPVDLSSVPEMERRADEDGPRYMREVFIDRQSLWLDHWAGRLERIEAIFSGDGRRLLDIGCGMGYFQLAAERKGWDTVGVELSGDQAAYARERLNLDVRSGRFEDAGLEPSSFDLITLWGVIEHVPEPRAFLVKARSLLKPGGLLVVQTPNQDSLITALAGLSYHLSGGHNMLSVYSLEHIFRFSAQTLHQLLEWSGFEIARIEQYDNLEVMLARMLMEPHAVLRRTTLTIIHALARLTRRRNQLIAYAYPGDADRAS